MSDIIKIILYLISIALALLCLYFVDFNKFMRIGKKEYAVVVYVLVAIAVGFLVGHFLVIFGTLFSSALS